MLLMRSQGQTPLCIGMHSTVIVGILLGGIIALLCAMQAVDQDRFTRAILRTLQSPDGLSILEIGADLQILHQLSIPSSELLVLTDNFQVALRLILPSLRHWKSRKLFDGSPLQCQEKKHSLNQGQSAMSHSRLTSVAY